MSMRAKPPNTHVTSQSWISTKRSPSPALPSIRDEDAEIESIADRDVDASLSPEAPCTSSGEESWPAFNQDAGYTVMIDGRRPSSYVVDSVASSTGLYTVSPQRGTLISSLSFSSAYATPASDNNTSPASPEGRCDPASSSSSSNGFLPDLPLAAADSRQHSASERINGYQQPQHYQQQHLTGQQQQHFTQQQQQLQRPQPSPLQHQQHPYHLQPLMQHDKPQTLTGIQENALVTSPRKPASMRMVNLVTAGAVAHGEAAGTGTGAGVAETKGAAGEGTDMYAQTSRTPTSAAPINTRLINRSSRSSNDTGGDSGNNDELQQEQQQSHHQQQQELQRERTRSLGRSRSEGPNPGAPLLPTKIHASLCSPGSETLTGMGSAPAGSRLVYFDLGALAPPFSAPHLQQPQSVGGSPGATQLKATSHGSLRTQPQPPVSPEGGGTRPRPPPLSLPSQQQQAWWGLPPASTAAAAAIAPSGSNSPGRLRGQGTPTAIPPPPVGVFSPIPPPSPSSSPSAGTSSATPLGVVGGLGVPGALFTRPLSPTLGSAGRLLRNPGPVVVRKVVSSQSSVPHPVPFPRATARPPSAKSEPLLRVAEAGVLQPIDEFAQSPVSPASQPLLVISESLPSPPPEQQPQPLPLSVPLPLPQALPPRPQLLSARNSAGATGPSSPTPALSGALATMKVSRPLTPSSRRSCPLPELPHQASAPLPYEVAVRLGADGASSSAGGGGGADVGDGGGAGGVGGAGGGGGAAAAKGLATSGTWAATTHASKTPHTAGAAAARPAAAKRTGAPAGTAGVAAATREVGRAHLGVYVDGAAGLLGLDMPSSPPEVVARPPRWLKPSAFQVTEQLRSGRLQELAERLSAVTCPTFLDLGGLEFSGSFSVPTLTADGGLYGSGGAAAATGVGSGDNWLAAGLSSATPRHRTLRLSLSGIGFVSQRGRYYRNSEVSSQTIGGAGGGRMQALVVPAGQHITLYNATLLLTAEQYVLVGSGASLTLKGVEVLGCSREAARTSAAVRRRALSLAAAAAAAASGGASAVTPSSSPAAAAAAGAAQQTAGTGSSNAAAGAAAPAAAAAAAANTSRLVRRASSPGRTDNASGAVPPGSTGRRASVTGSAVDGTLGLPPVRRRIATVSGAPPLMSSNLPPVLGVGAAPNQELVDPNEYVEDHALIEVVGGYVRISNCRLWPGRCQMALCVSNGGNCSMSYCTAGTCCAAGAKSALSSEHTAYDGGPAGCVSVLYGAKVGLTGCQIRYSDGAVVQDGCDLGLEARGSGTLAVLVDCEVTSGGVSASGGARVYLSGTHVSDARSYGVMACDPGTTVYVRDCRVNDSGGSAAVAADGGTLRLVDTTLAGSSGPGLLLLPYNPPAAEAASGRGGGDAAAAAAVSTATAIAPSSQCTGKQPPPPPPSSHQHQQHPPRSSATLARCDVSANAGHGVHTSAGCIASLKDCIVYNNLGSGVALEGSGTAVSAMGARLIRNEGHGVRVMDGAGAALSRCSFISNGRDGLSVEGVGSRSKLLRCESRENRESGLCITGSASVELSHTRLAANQHDGLAVGGSGSLALAHDCVFNGNVAKGAVVCMGASSELIGCAVHCNGSKSVQVSDEDSQLLLSRCSLDRQPAAVSGGTLVLLE